MTANVYSSKADVAYAELRRLILLGALPPGSRLPQYEIAGSLNMSITPFREAVRRLSSEGLIDLDTHRDARVASISAAEARQLFAVRLLLDPSAVELAAAHRTDDDVTTIEAAARRLRPITREGGEEALAVHREFHRTIYRASHNEVLTRILDDLWDKSDRYRRVGLELPETDEHRQRDLDEHRQMLDLVVAGDGAAAAELMRGHVTRSITPAAIAALERRES
jgi:DNA-binding GntR family transcriptional regulator